MKRLILLLSLIIIYGAAIAQPRLDPTQNWTKCPGGLIIGDGALAYKMPKNASMSWVTGQILKWNKSTMSFIVGNDTVTTSIPWAQIVNTPTNIAGYGISDAYTKTQGDARYAPIAHNQAWSTITMRPTTLSGYGITDASPLVHTHVISDIQHLGDSLIDKYTRAQATALFAAIGHNHAGVYAPISHTHSQNDVSHLVDSLLDKLPKSVIYAYLNGKSNTGHIHSISEVTSLSDSLTNAYWHHEASNNAENNFTVPVVLKPTTVIQYNGAVLRPSQWSGIGSTTLTINCPSLKYDSITIIK